MKKKLIRYRFIVRYPSGDLDSGTIESKVPWSEYLQAEFKEKIESNGTKLLTFEEVSVQ